MADVPPTELCGLGSKMHSLMMLCDTCNYRRAKEIPKMYVKNTKHEEYLHVLNHWNHRVTTH